VLYGLEWRIHHVKSSKLQQCLMTLFGPAPRAVTHSVLAPSSLSDLQCPRMPEEPQSCFGVGDPAGMESDARLRRLVDSAALKVCCPCARRCNVRRQVGWPPEDLLRVETKCSKTVGRCLVLPSNTTDVWESPEEQSMASWAIPKSDV